MKNPSWICLGFFVLANRNLGELPLFLVNCVITTKDLYRNCNKELARQKEDSLSFFIGTLFLRAIMPDYLTPIFRYGGIN